MAYLTLGEQSDLRFTINPEDITGNTAILDTAGLSMSASATISPFLTTLISASAQTVRLVESSSDLSGFSSGIAGRLPEDGHPFIYNVALSIDESGSQDAIVAEFAVKSAVDLGLNKTEAAALPAVLSHFRSNRNLETAITGVTNGDDFAAYYGQLLPQYGDGTMKQLAALAQSATGSVAQHLQIVAAADAAAATVGRSNSAITASRRARPKPIRSAAPATGWRSAMTPRPALSMRSACMRR